MLQLYGDNQGASRTLAPTLGAQGALCAEGRTVWCAASHFPPFRRQLLVFQAPGTPIIARQVTPTTIIKQVSQAQTTVQPSTALQRSPGVQVSWGLGGAHDAGVRGRASRVWVLDARVRDLGQEMLWNKVPFLCPPAQGRPDFSKTREFSTSRTSRSLPLCWKRN